MAINRIKTGGITDATIQSGDIAPGTIANDRLAGSVANAKLANSAITINGTSIALGASGEIVAGTDWQALTVADGSTTLTAEAGKGYFLDTNAGVIEVFLPTSPSRGDTVVLVDYAGTFSTNRAIVNTGTNNLDSTTNRQYKLVSNDTVAEFIYVDANKGWITKMLQAAGTTPDSALDTFGGYNNEPPEIKATGGTITTSGDYKIHTFTGDGTFAVTQLSPTSARNTVSYLVIGGGGGTGSSGGNSAGGGGAGGYREGRNQPVDGYTASPLVANAPTNAITLTTSPGSYPITVGGGGTGAPGNPGSPETPGTNGSNSVFSTITGAGGGFGAGTQAPGNGGPGGSGGGGGGGGLNRPGGTGNTPPVSPAQGQNGGSSPTSGGDTNGGGGGGAGQAGQNANQSVSGNGGNGVSTEITGSAVTRAGGGVGGAYTPSGDTIGTAGSGGGGGSSANARGTDGTANTGGGGGGPSSNSSVTGSAGGKGLVVIRYKYQ